MPKSELKTASVLAFERKLDPSDALLYSGQWDNRSTIDAWTPISVREKSVRGTISNRLGAKEQDPAVLDAKIENPNLQTVDVATMPHDADTLLAKFTLRVLSGAGVPSACNNSDYRQKLSDTVSAYIQSHGFEALAERYAQNLANGRFLWRNRVGAEQVEVQISQLENGQAKKTWSFDAYSFSMRDFETPVKAKQDLGEITHLIAMGLAGDGHALLEIRAFARLGYGQEVFPSQELILDRDKSNKSKTLYTVAGVAGIHSQKLGNALRTIDTWYPSEADALGPIAVEPYGSVTTQGKAYRQPKQKADFYSLLDGWILRDDKPATEQQHFVMATLIRGGVFGDGKA